jgi:hypothetical protein
MRVTIFQLLFFSTIAFAQEPAPKSSSFLKIDHFEIRSTSRPEILLKIPSNLKPTQIHSLEPGDNWIGELTLKGNGPLADLRVTIQHINVMSLSNEGPHIDLTNWRTYESEEMIVDAIKDRPGVFLINRNYIKEHAFPFTSKADLLKGIKDHIQTPGSGYSTKESQSEAIERWSRLAKTCVGPVTYPCSVGIGQVILRVYAPGTTPPAAPVKELTLTLPQGC